MNFLLSILYVIGLYGAYTAGFLYLRDKSIKFHLPWTTSALLFAIGIPSILQFFLPILLTAFQRNPAQMYQGEWWRVVTFLYVQDGGVAGTTFNLVSLLLIGGVAEQFWKSGYVALLFFLGGIFGGLVALAWQPMGAGNSVGNFSLAASVAMIILRRSAPPPVKIAAWLAIVAYIVLLALKDIHGAASITGLVLAFFLFKQARSGSVAEA